MKKDYIRISRRHVDVDGNVQTIDSVIYKGSPYNGYTLYRKVKTIYTIPASMSWQMVLDYATMRQYLVENITEEDLFLEDL